MVVDNSAPAPMARRWQSSVTSSAAAASPLQVPDKASNNNNSLHRPFPNRPANMLPTDQEKMEKSKAIMRKFFLRRPDGNSSSRQERAPLGGLAKLHAKQTEPQQQRQRQPNNTRPTDQAIDALRTMTRSHSLQLQSRPSPQIRQGQSYTPRSNHNNHHTHNKQQPRPSSQQLSQTSNRPVSPFPSSMDNKDKSSFPLSEFIRRMQLDHEKKQQERLKQQNNTLVAASTLPDPLPKWRMVSDAQHNNNNTNSNPAVNLRDMRRQERYRHHHRRQAPAHLSDFITQDQQQQENGFRRRPVYKNPKKQVVVIPSYPVSLAEASLLFREKTRTLQRKLHQLNENSNELLEPSTMELLAMSLGRKVEVQEAKRNDHDDILMQRRLEQEAATQGYEELPPRAPVVTLMGHVDHGKTSLMDSIRRRSQLAAGVETSKAGGKQKKKTKGKSGTEPASRFAEVAGTEAGGITQVVSAFQVHLDGMDQAVTFLDTPGHAAFRSMRRSGSDAADIIVLVVAADDGVSKQTVEILDFYKSIVSESGDNGISLVVAMNKIDKPGVEVEEARRRIEMQLQEHGILIEGMPSAHGSDFGLPVEIYPVSALTGEGLDDLIEGLSLQAEVMDLRAESETPAEGLIMDARVDKGVGIVVDAIVRWGSISKGDIVVSGTAIGKVRLLKDMNDQPISQGLPSQPVRIVGFDSVPKAGDSIVCVESEEAADELVERRKALETNDDRAHAADAVDAELQSSGKHLLHNDWRDKLEEKHGIDSGADLLIRIPVIIKADADGTLAAVRESLIAIGDESCHKVVIDPVRVGVGPVLASDVQLAKEGGATIIAFNLKHSSTISSMADEESVKLVTSKVIYSLLDEAREEFARYMPAEPVEVVHGRGKVQAVFEIGGIDDKVAGLKIADGVIYKDKATTKDGAKLKSEFRVLRAGKVVSESSFVASSLKYFKEDVNEVGRGKECGLSLAGCSEFEEGDEIECFSVEMKRKFA